MTRSVNHAARMALDCQEACNLSGVVYTFAEIMSALWEEAHTAHHGTAWVNRHPVVTLMLDKLTQLNGHYIHADLKETYAEVERLAGSAR